MDNAVVKFYCPNCQQKLSTQAEYAGQTIQCPACNTLMRVPSPSSESPPAPPPTPPPTPASGLTATPMDTRATTRMRPVPGWALYAAGVAFLVVAVVGGVMVHFASQPAPQPPGQVWKDLPPPPPTHPANATADKVHDETRTSHSRRETAAVTPSRATTHTNAVPPTTDGKPKAGEPEAAAGRKVLDLRVDERKQIFAELMEADVAAVKAADRRFPDDPSASNMQAVKRRKFQSEHLRELRRAIGEKHGLTSEQIANILAEGIENMQTDALITTDP